MKITFISNFMNHHQLPLSLELTRILGDDFKFIATEKIPNERLNMGYEDMNSSFNFIIKAYENKELAKKLAIESDIVIIGSAPKKYIKKRFKFKNKVTFAYSERLFRGNKYKILLKKYYYKYVKERKQSDKYYLLSASAFSGYDYNSLGLFINKVIKWGYFPEVKKYKNIKEIINKKKCNSIIWVGRFLNWKHPELVIELAKKLKENNYEFKIKMIGIGEEYELIRNMIKDYNLESNIDLLGSMSPDRVREHMESSEIFLFTSDKYEGWGAVLNEAMNSGCAVIASHEIGSVPFLISNKKNGLVFKSKDIKDLFDKTKRLLENKDLTKKYGINAYNTMINLWNPQNAAKRIISLSKKILDNNKLEHEYIEGPGSMDSILNDNWFFNMEE